MRTDIPAFYSAWLERRIREGYVLVRNPYNPAQVTRYDLAPNVVDLIGFCTKNPAPMLGRLDVLEPYGQYWFVTITGYGHEFEPCVPPAREVVRAFCELARRLGPACMGWRYDPIIVDEAHDMAWHEQRFGVLARALEGATDTCVISFVELYDKVRRNNPQLASVPQEVRVELCARLVSIAREHGMVVKPCGNSEGLAQTGADCSGCISIATYERALGVALEAPRRQALRKECACYLAPDIGAYNSCPHLCRYCYANYSASAVRRNAARHDPASPFLIGGPEPGDVIHQAEQKSWRRPQLSLF